MTEIYDLIPAEINKPNKSIDEAFVFTNYNVEVKDKYVYYPIYILMFLNDEDVKLPIVDISDLSELFELK